MTGGLPHAPTRGSLSTIQGEAITDWRCVIHTRYIIGQTIILNNPPEWLSARIPILRDGEVDPETYIEITEPTDDGLTWVPLDPSEPHGEGVIGYRVSTVERNDGLHFLDKEELPRTLAYLRGLWAQRFGDIDPKEVMVQER